MSYGNTFNQVPRTGHPAGGSQRLGPYGTGPHYKVTTPWAVDVPEADRVGGGRLQTTITDARSPHQGLTCEKFGDQTFLRGNLETVDANLVRGAIQEKTHPARLYSAFQVFDHDNKGAITPTQFRRTVEAVMPGFPGWATAQMMLLGVDGSGQFFYQRMMRSLGFTELTGALPAEKAAMQSSARAAGTSGDIISHRDDTDFELVGVKTPGSTPSVQAVAATTSGDIIGHTSPIRSADLAWDMKGRVFDNQTGTVLEYSTQDFSSVHDQPGKYSSYRNSGDIIANTDFRIESQRKLWDTKRQGNVKLSSPLC